MSAPEYFAKATRSELELVLRLPPRQLRVWFGVRLLGRNGWAIRRRDLEAVTRMGERQVQLGLAELERGGYLRRTFCAEPSAPWGRFRADAIVPGRAPGTPIPEIGVPRSRRSGSPPEPRSGGSGYTIQGSDLGDPLQLPDPGSDPSLQPEPPARPSEGRPRAGGPVEDLIRELWPDVVRPGLFAARLQAAGGDELAEHELVAYLRWAHRHVDAKGQLGAACTRDRLEPWLRRRRREDASSRQDASSRPSGPALSSTDAVELAERALRSLK